MDTSRPPVVAILGHVDHGKTTLLDFLRKSRITTKEHGGITQKIGAYEVQTDIKDYKVSKLTFIDTPGHEAFTKLRARGATVADIAILIIDAKDSVMPQTEESIAHIKAAKIPYLVTLNKIDLPESQPEKVKNDLLKYQVQVEGKGGNVPVALISAKTGQGVKELLETILLMSADLNLTYKSENPLKAYIIETKRDRRGIVVSAIVKDGKLRVGATVYCEGKEIRIRALINDVNHNITEALPSTPVEILGFSEFPSVGSLISTVKEDLSVKIPSQPEAKSAPFSLETILAKPSQEKKLSLLIKADSQGSLEAINASLKNKTNIEIVYSAVGTISKSDVFLAKTTQSIIIGFAIEMEKETLELSKQEKVIIKSYNIIYDLLDELSEVADLLKEKESQLVSYKGEGNIVANFTIDGEKIFGVKVVKGKINLTDEVEVYRNENLLGRAKLVSLKIRAKSVQEVKRDQECGMVLNSKLDIRIGDVIKSIS